LGWCDEIGIALNAQDLLVPEPTTALLLAAATLLTLIRRRRR